jgi:hypothetical protein
MASTQKQKTAFGGSVAGLLNEPLAGSIDIVGSRGNIKRNDNSRVRIARLILP